MDNCGFYSCHTVRKMSAEIGELEEKITELEKFKTEKEYYDNLCHKKTVECDDLREGIKQFQADNEKFIKRIFELEKENEELKKDKGWLDNTNNEQTEVILKLNEQIEKMKSFCTKLIEANNELRKSLRKYEIVPDVDYLPNGLEVYKENVGNNPYDIK